MNRPILLINEEGLSEREILLAGQVLKEAGHDRALYTSPGRWNPQMVSDAISYMEMTGRPRDLQSFERTILKDLRANLGWYAVRSRQQEPQPIWPVKFNDSPHHDLPKQICAVALNGFLMQSAMSILARLSLTPNFWKTASVLTAKQMRSVNSNDGRPVPTQSKWWR